MTKACIIGRVILQDDSGSPLINWRRRSTRHLSW